MLLLLVLKFLESPTVSIYTTFVSILLACLACLAELNWNEKSKFITRN